ncbi:MAG TPA: hypothetical protein VGO56_05940 [Pyrinomonadaceae bacterium]|jgi:hypothetical protein|nr:hypothetical protein [Pyrinomonadaceae bacterium]
MSYLDIPRLHFAGTFIAKPSTVNNTGSNFEPNVTDPYPSWNPNGNHYWQFLNCTVKSAFDSGGAVTQDPVLSAAVTSTDNPSPAKLVDLDTEQQMVSQIWGLQVKLAIANSDYLVGDFAVVCFNDIFVRVLKGKPDSMFSAYFQSVLENVSWSDQLSSPLLQKLRELSPDSLSIKFVVDGYNDDSGSAQFNQGRIVGTIGPDFADEPPNFVIGRALRPAGGNSPLSFGYARVDEKRGKVLLDLGNSISTTSPQGPPPDLGTLQLAIVPPSGSPSMLGQYDYSQNAYLTTAGIQEFDATAEQLQLLRSTPLGIVQTTKPGDSPVVPLQEGANCTYINATQIVYRMNPGDTACVDLIAVQFGERAANQSISLALNGDALQPAPISAAPPFSPQPPQPATPTPVIPVATPASALTFIGSVTTDADGVANFEMTAADPGNPRHFIDGQVYNVSFTWTEDQDDGFPPDPNGTLSVLVFDSYQAEPTWASVEPFLSQYAKLYPFMDSLFPPGLADPQVYQQNIEAFKHVLAYPLEDPRYMPVTRDMSADKRQVLIAWLDAGAPGPN